MYVTCTSVILNLHHSTVCIYACFSQVNIGLLVLSLAGFGLPTYLWWYQKSIDGKEEITDRPLEPIKEVDEENLNNMSGSKLLHNHHLDIDEQAMHLSISAITF